VGTCGASSSSFWLAELLIQTGNGRPKPAGKVTRLIFFNTYFGGTNGRFGIAERYVSHCWGIGSEQFKWKRLFIALFAGLQASKSHLGTPGSIFDGSVVFRQLLALRPPSEAQTTNGPPTTLAPKVLTILLTYRDISGK
jgi:hypothetical protein